MIDAALATAALSAFAATVGFADTVYTSWCNYLERRRIERPAMRDFGEQVSLSADGAALRHDVRGKVRRTVSRDELAAWLDEAELKDIISAEAEMKDLVRDWVALANRPAPFDAGERSRLDEIADGLAAHMRKITDRLDRLGFRLDDHYQEMKQIAATVR